VVFFVKFIETNQRFFIKIDVVNMMICFMNIINIIIMLILIKNHWFVLKILTKGTKLHQFLKNW